MEQAILPRTELIGGDPDLAAAGVIDLLREPAQRTVVIRRFGGTVRERRHAIESALLHPVESADGRPGTFVVAGGDLTGRADGDAIGSSETRGYDLEFLAVRGNLEERTVVVANLVEAAAALADRTGLDEVEVAGGVGLQVEDELVEILRDHHVEVEGLIGIALAVAVRVAQFPDTVAARDEDFPVHDLEPKGMIQAGGETTPSHLRQVVVDARGDEDVAMEGADDGAAVG